MDLVNFAYVFSGLNNLQEGFLLNLELVINTIKLIYRASWNLLFGYCQRFIQ